MLAGDALLPAHAERHLPPAPDLLDFLPPGHGRLPLRAEHDERVQRLTPLRISVQRVDLERFEPRAQLKAGPSDGEDGVDQGCDGDRRTAPRALQQRGAAQLVEHLANVGRGDREQAGGDVAQHLDEDATHPHHEDVSPLRIARDADEQLDPAAAHRCHEHTFRTEIWNDRTSRCDHALERGPDGVSAVDAETYGADVALVVDQGGDQLDGHGSAGVSCRRGSGVGVGDQHGRNERDPGGGEQLT